MYSSTQSLAPGLYRLDDIRSHKQMGKWLRYVDNNAKRAGRSFMARYNLTFAGYNGTAWFLPDEAPLHLQGV